MAVASSSSSSSSRSAAPAGGGGADPADHAEKKKISSCRDHDAMSSKRKSKLLRKAARTILKGRSDRALELRALARVLPKDGGRRGVMELADGAEAVCPRALRSALRGSKRFQLVVEKPPSSPGAAASPEGAVVVRLAKRTKTKKNSKADLLPRASTSSLGSSTDPSGAEDATALWRRKNKVVVISEQEQVPERPLVPIRAFEDLMTDGEGVFVPGTLIQHLRSRFKRPSPIQAQAWPVLLGGCNLVGIAETGSGKTLGFCLPALVQLASTSPFTSTNDGTECGPTDPRRRRPVRMLVLSPTRELALQSHAVLEEYGTLVNVSSLVVYGGVPKSGQEQVLRRGNVDAVVATPGRLKDLLSEPVSSRGRSRGGGGGGVGPVLDLSTVQYLVLDEADRMLDFGFVPDVLDIVSRCTRPGRQTCLFSATWPASVREVAANLLNTTTEEHGSHPHRALVRVYVGFETLIKDLPDGASKGGDDPGSGTPQEANVVVDDALSANKRVQQRIEVLEDHQRESRLRQLLSQVLKQPAKCDPRRVLVFCLYKKEAERLEQRLARAGYNCASIHGNKAQSERTRSLDKFKSGEVPLLIATDVAARGLHIPSVYMVINYTFPLTIEDYVHRIGRTGRAGKSGLSVTFFQPLDKARAGELQQVLRQAGQAIPDALAKFGSTVKRKEHKLYGSFASGRGPGPMKKPTKITFNDSDDESTEAVTSD